MRHFRIYVFFLSTLFLISCGAEEKDKKTPQPVTEEEKKESFVYLNRSACEEANKNGKYHFMVHTYVTIDDTRERRKFCFLTNSTKKKEDLEFLGYKTKPSCQSDYLGCVIGSDKEGTPQYTFVY